MNGSGTSNGNAWLSIAAKYGITGVIALYLTYYMTNVMTQKLTNIEHYEAQQTEILEDIRYALRQNGGIVFRNSTR